MFSHVFKFNQNHDERGRFASSSSDTVFSPNIKEGMSVRDAVAATRSSEQKKYIAISKKVDSLVGLKPDAHSAVGAWSDGGENSIVGVYPKASFAKVEAAVAMKGLLAEQKAVIAYQTKAGGPSRLHTITGLPEAPAEELSAALSKSGIEYHTLVNTGHGYDVMVFEEKKDPALSAKVVDFAKAAGGSVHHTDGVGEFLGSWSSRSEGAASYRRVIDKYLKDKPTISSAWDSMLKGHKFRASKMAGLFMGVS